MLQLKVAHSRKTSGQLGLLITRDVAWFMYQKVEQQLFASQFFLKLPLANQNSWNIFCDCLHFSSQHNIDYWHLSVSKTICSRQQKSFFLSLTQFTDEFTTLMMTTPQISGEKAQQQQLLLWGSRNPNYNLLPSVQNQRHSNCFSHYGYCMLGGQTETTCKNSLDFHCCLVICSISPVLKGLDG